MQTELKLLPDDAFDADIVPDDTTPTKTPVVDTSKASTTPDNAQAPVDTTATQVNATTKEIKPKSGSLPTDKENISQTVMSSMKARHINGNQQVGGSDAKRTSLFKSEPSPQKATTTQQAVDTSKPTATEAEAKPKADTVTQTTSTLPAVPDDIDESNITLADQEKQHLLSLEAHARKLIEKTFIHTDIKLQKDDPLIQWFIGSQNILIDVANKVADKVLSVMVEELEATRLTQQTKYDEEARQAKYQANLVNEVFRKNVEELRALSTMLDDRKELLLAEVWAKTDQRMIEHFTKLINDNLSKGINDGIRQSIGNMAKNANSTVNNERMLNKGMLKGGAIGLGVGLAIGVFMVILLLIFK